MEVIRNLHPSLYCLCDTVIGPKVSLVARMITAYPGLVCCDEVTYLRSMLPAYNFKKLPEKMMKNISNPGKIYEYVGHRRCMWVSLCDSSLPSVLQNQGIEIISARLYEIRAVLPVQAWWSKRRQRSVSCLRPLDFMISSWLIPLWTSVQHEESTSSRSPV